MKIVLATGIYPPEVGGPATYVHALAKELVAKGIKVCVVTYGKAEGSDSWKVITVSKSGGPLIRWWRYSRALKECGCDSDIVYAFSSVSCGVPLWLANLKRPLKVLRLGGDFFWERYTDIGGRKTLRDWYASNPLSRRPMQWLLSRFNHIVFSTEFQQEIYKKYYKVLPEHSTLENAVPSTWNPHAHKVRDPFRLLVMSRLVRFKNLESLVHAMSLLSEDILLTIVGEGPCKGALFSLMKKLKLDGRIAFATPLHGSEKREIFNMHEAIVIPSLTDISPNAALEAASTGLPVLLTSETGLSDYLTRGMTLVDLRTPEKIADAIKKLKENYPVYTVSEPHPRSWENVAEEHIFLFKSLL